MSALYWSGYQLSKLISKGVFRIRVYGRDNVPKTGGFILAPNHRSYYDPPIVGCWTRRKVYFMAKAELMKSGFGKAFFGQLYVIPVRRGTVDRNAQKLVLGAIGKGEGVTIFPEGTRSRTDGFLPPKPGIGLVAHLAKCPIVPAYLHGSDDLGKAFRGQKKMGIIYGEPIPAEWLESLPAERESYLKIADEVMVRIRGLREELLEKL